MTPMIGSGAFAAPVDPLTLHSWVHAFWASDPNWTPPADGGEVTSWRDAGSAALNLAKISATGPTYRANAAHFGDQPVVQFDGAEYMRTAVGSNSTAARTVVVVGNIDKAANSSTMIDAASGTCRIGQQNVLLYLVSRGSNVAGTGFQHECDPHLWIVGFDGASTTFHVDNMALTVATDPGSTSCSGLTVGAQLSGSAPMNGSVAFAGVVSGLLDATQRSALWAWAAATYQLRSE